MARINTKQNSAKLHGFTVSVAPSDADSLKIALSFNLKSHRLTYLQGLTILSTPIINTKNQITTKVFY